METGDNMEKGAKAMGISAGITGCLYSILLCLLDFPSRQTYILNRVMVVCGSVLFIVVVVYYRRKLKNNVKNGQRMKTLSIVASIVAVACVAVAVYSLNDGRDEGGMSFVVDEDDVDICRSETSERAAMNSTDTERSERNKKSEST